jgi:hypothetical protein
VVVLTLLTLMNFWSWLNILNVETDVFHGLNGLSRAGAEFLVRYMASYARDSIVYGIFSVVLVKVAKKVAASCRCRELVS